MAPGNVPGAVAVSNPPGDLATVRVIWTGTACDTTARVDISKTLDSIEVRPGDRQACDAGGVGRGVVLTFGRAVPASSITVRLHRPALLESP